LRGGGRDERRPGGAVCRSVAVRTVTWRGETVCASCGFSVFHDESDETRRPAMRARWPRTFACSWKPAANNPRTAPSSALACLWQESDCGTVSTRSNACRRREMQCNVSQLSAEVRVVYTRIFAVSPLPPVDETNLIRRNLACTFATVRASPAVAVLVSIV